MSNNPPPPPADVGKLNELFTKNANSLLYSNTNESLGDSTLKVSIGAANDGKKVDAEGGQEAPYTVDSTTGFWNQYSFKYMYKIVTGAREGLVGMKEMVLPPPQTAEASYEAFKVEWDKEVSKNPQPSLRRVLWNTWGAELMVAGLWKLLWSFCVIMGAFFFVRSLQFHVNKQDFISQYQGWILAAFYFVDAYVLGVSLQRMSFGCMKVGIKVRSALVNAICRKSFSMASITKEASSDCVSFVASDIQKLNDGIQEIHYLWTAPIEAITILTILTVLVKLWALPAWLIVGTVMSLQYYFGYLIICLKKGNAALSNERASFFQELLPAMKLVKFYAWEDYFINYVGEVRARELINQVKIAWIKTCQTVMVFGTPPVTAITIFAAYETNVGKINATLTFPILSLFNILRFPLVVLPKAMRATSDMLNSIERIQAFLRLEVPVRTESKGAPGVDMKAAEFKHPGDKTDFVLRVPEFSVHKGELVAVVGRVGAGKSSLVSAILGNMNRTAGQAQSGGKVAYVPQNPWCQNMSLRESILFGSAFDEDRYDTVIHACALELDLQILADGDETKAGLRGINLSGGQRQRLNLARCAYAQSEVVLLDNALSAVDHHTAHHIFKHCIRTMLADKAVVLITHQVEFLPQCDKVAIMDGGNMLYFGKYNEKACELLGKVLPASHLLAAAGGGEQPRDPPAATKKKEKLRAGLSVGASGMINYLDKKDKKVRRSALTQWEGISCYLAHAPWYVWAFVINVFWYLLSQTARQISDWWLSQWSADTYMWYPKSVVKDNPLDAKSPFPNLSAGEAYVVCYAIPIGVFLVAMFFRGQSFFWWSRTSGQRIHTKAVHNTMFAPLIFFLNNPVGEILLAFTKDQDIMDEQLLDNLHYLGIFGLIILATTITVSVTMTFFSVFAGILIIVTIIMLVYYLPAATTLKVLRTNTAGDLVGLVAESLEGLNIIQAMGKTNYFVETAMIRNNHHHATVFTAESLNLWLAHWCDLYGAIMVLAVACFAVGMATELGASKVGLAFSNTIQMLVFYTWTVRFIADALFNMASVEKMGWLATDVSTEGAATSGSTAEADRKNKEKENKTSFRTMCLSPTLKVKEEKEVQMIIAPSGATWPSCGTVTFENVWMKYGPTAPFALKGVSFTLSHQDKVGVVGRTGSGKSTCLLALYRMFDLDKGRIVIDGIDISFITLKQLRRNLSIIPQEPVVFAGTVRTNLDPFNEHTDADLNAVIKEASLEEQVKNAGGLSGKVSGVGSGAWSLGQQQLVCLARAALRKVPVLCLDEATSAMDPQTEQEVGAVIKRVFKERTIITIAHRLDTVIESDKVLVMEAGVLKEQGPCTDLLANPDSMFSLLVDKTGAQAAQALRQLAAEFRATREASGHK